MPLPPSTATSVESTASMESSSAEAAAMETATKTSLTARRKPSTHAAAMANPSKRPGAKSVSVRRGLKTAIRVPVAHESPICSRVCEARMAAVVAAAIEKRRAVREIRPAMIEDSPVMPVQPPATPPPTEAKKWSHGITKAEI